MLERIEMSMDRVLTFSCIASPSKRFVFVDFFFFFNLPPVELRGLEGVRIWDKKTNKE